MGVQKKLKNMKIEEKYLQKKIKMKKEQLKN